MCMNPEQGHEAILYQKLADDAVQCELCAHYCRIPAGAKGLCGELENIGGILYANNYGRLIALHVDPVEKKPLFHFYPGSRCLSLAAPGCNLRCRWCQNWSISQAGEHNAPDKLPFVSPESVVKMALAKNCISIAYTYTEPTVFFEFALEVSKLARKAGLKNIFISNGYMSAKMLDLYMPFLDAANIDLKAFNEERLRRWTGAKLTPILDSLRRLKAGGIWLELTSCLVPGVNDDDRQLRDMATFIACELGSDTPWHLSRYFPQLQFNKIEATPLATIEKAEKMGREAGLKFVYAGNIANSSSMFCSVCGQELLRHQGYGLSKNCLVGGKCPDCGTRVPGYWV